MENATDRIKRLAAAARTKEVPSLRSAEGELLWFRGWLANKDASSNIVRRAAAKADMHRLSTPVIGQDELIVGKPCFRRLTPAEQQELDDYKTHSAPMLPRLDGQASHMAVDYEKLLKIGILGIKEEIETFRDGLDPMNAEQLERDEFYRACLIALDGVLEYAKNYAGHARAQAETANVDKKRELLEIAVTLDKVPARPAGSFREALQSVHFLTFCLEGLYQLGRPDRYLLEYYRRDAGLGMLDRRTAQELIDCICVLFNEYIPGGLAVGFMVGGHDKDGRDVCNELTELFLSSIGHTRMIYPGVGLCCTNDMPDALFEKSCGLLSEGLSHPALFNDAVITSGLKSYGLPAEEACLYIHSTCVEITPIASSAVWVASPYINLPQLLLDCLGIAPLGEAAEGGAAPEFGSFDALIQEFRERLDRKIRAEAVCQNRQQMNRALHGGDPLVSSFVNDCLARGKDVDQGGARHNWIMPSFVGLSNLADSFTAIRQLVFEEKLVTQAELTDALLSDFEGYEPLMQKVISRVPKYGNDDDKADGMVGRISGWIVEEMKKLSTFRGDRFIPSLFCWVMHEQLGSRTQATPDGRRRAFPLGDGSGPAQGREKKGPTASLLSSTKWAHTPFIGGIAVNLKFSKTLFGPQSQAALAALVKTFIERGGFELQVNAVDRETLLKARENPATYGDLVVRVGGYSDYFVRLSPSMQDEIIARTGHGI